MKAQQRDGRWCIVELVGRHGRVRTVPMPTWVKVAIDSWIQPAGIADGTVFRSVSRGGEIRETALSEKVVWQMLRPTRQLRRCRGSRPTTVAAQPRSCAGPQAAS